MYPSYWMSSPRELLVAAVVVALLVPTVGAMPPAFGLKWGTLGNGDEKFSGPHRMVVDGEGDMYVADRNNNRMQKFTGDGTFVTTWGIFGVEDGQFNRPYAVASGTGRSIYVGDSSNHRIQKFVIPEPSTMMLTVGTLVIAGMGFRRR